MTTLILGMALFIAVHSIPSFLSFRQQLVNRLSENGYKTLFSITSVLALIIIVKGKASADYILLWQPLSFGKILSAPLMLISLCLFVSSNIPNNSKRITPHPVAWSVILWAIAHLLVNGELSSLLLFGGLAAFASGSIISANIRGAEPAIKKQPLKNDILVVLSGTIIFTTLFYFHQKLFGAALF